MTSSLQLSVGAFFTLMGISASAQTLPPANPYMGSPGTATMHANAASSNATTNPGPGSGAISITARNIDAVFPTILMGTDGLIVSVATKWSDQTPYVYLLDSSSRTPVTWRAGSIPISTTTTDWCS